MTVVLVHGLPETRDIWGPLSEILDRDAVAVALPGFGTARPDGVTASKDAYADCLGERLSRIEEPVDVVGYDVGALLTMRVASAFDVPLRSWVVDVANIFHPRFAWPERVRKMETTGSAGKCLRPPVRSTPAAAGSRASPQAPPS